MKKFRRYDGPGAQFHTRGWALILALIACIAIGVTGLAGTTTATTLASDNNASAYGENVTFTATVSPTPDGGTVTFKDGTTTLATVSVNTTTGKATYSTDSLSVGTHAITAEYSGTTNFAASTSNTVNQKVVRASKVTVFCSDTPLVVNDTATGTVTVTGLPSNASAPPTGTVHLSHTGNGTLSPTSYTLQEADGGQFQFTYTPADGDDSPHKITAIYNAVSGSGYSDGAGTFDQEVIKRSAVIKMNITPTTAYILQPVTISIHVEDDTTAGTPGSFNGVEVTLNDGVVKNGTFDHSDGVYTLNGDGNCTAIYIPRAGDAGTITITATLDESSVYKSASASGLLTAQLRPTQTTVTFATSDGILVNEPTTFTVMVKDEGGATSETVTPQGTINVTKSLSPTGEGHIAFSSASATDTYQEWKYGYVRVGLDAEGVDYDVITASYTPNDGVHTGSEGKYGKSISRRPTVVTISNPQATATGAQCTVKVEEDSGNAGVPSTPTGEFYDEEKGAAYAGISPPGPGIITKDVSDPDHTLLVNMTVRYKPNDRVHMTSVAGVNVDRSSLIPVDPGDGTNGSGCSDGCGSGGTDIEKMIFNMNAAIVSLHAVQMGLDAAATIASLFPDPVWTTGIVFESGTEIPAKDIVIAALEGTNQLLEVAIVAMETDLDGDGIPDVVEENVTHTKYNNIDSDGDGMDDLDEIDNAGGYYGGSRRPDPNEWDSDGDGLGDGDEADNVGTSFCVQDTDCDGVTDYQEYITYANYDSKTKGSTTARPDTRDQSNPLAPDTDGDGLNDSVEYLSGHLATDTTTPPSVTDGDGGYSPYVNDSDSDGDGIPDGDESTNGNAIWDYTQLGSTGTTGSGETHLCLADTDGDGLSDGQEEGLLGRGAVTAVTPSGDVTTVPALDTDSDDDGLSDYEEVNVTHTDPLNWDTDGDGLSDLNELIATGGTYPHRSFQQVSDPLDPDTDDDGLRDNIEYDGTKLGTSHGLGGSEDLACPFVNDDDSDDDGLQDGVEDANHDGTWGVNGSGCTIGSFDSQAAPASDGYYETDLCNPDTDGDGILDGEEVSQLGGGPISDRPTDWPATQPSPGFNTVTPEGRSTVLPTVDYSGNGPLYNFTPTPGPAIAPTVPALDVDSDNDGLSDYEEVNTTGTDPLDADSDNDTIMDADELIATGGTPGATPNRTFEQESDPLDINTDDDYLPDPVEGSCNDPTYTGTGLGALAGALGGTRDTDCPYVNNADSDNDGVQDGAVIPLTHEGPNGFTYSYVFIEGFRDVAAADVQAPGTVRTVVTPATGEQHDDQICNVCDSDSDGDGLTDGQEVGLGTDPQDWDTDDDGRSDGHEVTGGGPIPTDPFDPDTDDDGLLDSAEVFGSNPTNPTVADTDGDGLCDGGAGTPYMVSHHPTVTVNPICKSCAIPGNAPCAGPRSGSADGIGDHPNRKGLGEDENGNGAWDSGETDPNQYDTDGDAEGDGIEKLGFSTSRQNMIPAADLFGRPIKVVYPAVGCMDPLNPDTDGDGLSDGYEDRNHDGNFDFLPSEFDHADPLPGPPIPYPTETNPCDPDTDHDGLSDYAERYQPNPNSAYPFNPTNPLDHDTDNDYILDGPEVNYVCTEITHAELDNDGDGLIDEDPPDGIDNDGDGLIDEDGPDFTVRHVDVLDPTNRDSDSDGFIDGLDDDPCNSELIPILQPVKMQPVDSDGDGFSDADERIAGTQPNDPDDHPTAYCQIDLDFDQEIDDRMWLEPSKCCDIANSVAIDIDSNGLVDVRVRIIAPRDVKKGDFDGDGVKDDYRYTVEYSLSNYRVVQPHVILTIYDYNGDLTIDHAEVTRK